MSSQNTLKNLEGLLESFLERALAAKEDRLTVLSGMNSLDDISRLGPDDSSVHNRLGDWLSEHSQWLEEGSLRPSDVNRIQNVLGEISNRLDLGSTDTPELTKIRGEVDNWQPPQKKGRRVIFKRPGESKPVIDQNPDSIARFQAELSRISELYQKKAVGCKHLLSVLDDCLKSAKIQLRKEPLLLAAFIIYSLKQDGYKVAPYVKKLKEAERLIEKVPSDA